MLILWLLVLALLWAVVYLHQRVGQLEQRLVDLSFSAFPLAPPLREEEEEEQAAPWPDAAPERPSEPVEAPAPAPAILRADVRPRFDEPELSPFPADEPVEEEAATKPRLGFEELFGRRLPIWAGGITLAVAGILIVRYSIEAGLLSPALRVVAGLLFGFGLIGGAEAARRRSDRVQDPRVAQALSGAGIATLYGSLLVAANLYGLIGGGLAMVGIALVTALAIVLSVRFGAPSALLGLAGGLAAPALIGSDQPNVPLLTLYLALAVGGLTAVSARQRWGWLGISALTGGFGWGLLLLVQGALDVPGTLALGGYLLVLGLLLPGLVMAGDQRARVQLVAALLAALQMSALLATGGFALLHWGLFGLLAIGIQWLAWRNGELRPLPALGAVVFALLAGVWPGPSVTDFILVGSVGLAIFLLPAAVRLWRPEGGLLEAGQIAGLALAGLVVPLRHFHLIDGSRDLILGALGLVLAGGVAALAFRGWRTPERRQDPRFALLAVTSTLLLCGAWGLLLPWWLVAGSIAAVGLGLLLLGHKAEDPRLEPVAWCLLGAGLALPFLGDLLGSGGLTEGTQEAVRFGLLFLVAAAFAWRGRTPRLKQAAQFGAVLTAQLALVEVMPDRWLALGPAAFLLLLGLFAARQRAGVRPALLTSLVLASLHALSPLFDWSDGALGALGGDPMLVTQAAEPFEAVVTLLLPALAAALGFRLARSVLRRREPVVTATILLLAAAGLHSLYKLLFALDSIERWELLGLSERLVWAGLLLGGALLLWRRGLQRPALWLGGAGLAYHLWHSLLLHNPLWSAQLVGPLPLLNLLLPLYLLPLAALWFVRSRVVLPANWRRGSDVAVMALILGLGLSLLRQAFAGGLLMAGTVTQAEDIARSILTIAAAILFLLWGIRSRNRDWRIASLVLMLGAAAKVFLFDAAGLTGLIRIASFVALGFSLIGIGWLYSRQLRREEPAPLPS